MNVLSSSISSYYPAAQDYGAQGATSSPAESSGNDGFYENLRAHLSEQKPSEEKQPATRRETKPTQTAAKTDSATPVKAKAQTAAQSKPTPASGDGKDQDAQPSNGSQSKQAKQDPNAKSAKANAIEAQRAINDEADSMMLSLDAAAVMTSDATAPKTANDTTQVGSTGNAKNVEAADESDGTQATVAAQPILGDLALALKIQSARASDDDNEEPDGIAPSIVPANGNSLLLSSGAQATAQAALHKDELPVEAIVAPEAVDGHKASSTDSQAGEPAGSTQQTTGSSADFEAELNKFRAAEPVRGAHVQITGADSQRVDVRLVERAGALSVTVRSADSNLTRSLQDHAQELNSNLHLEHYHSDLWTPSPARGSSSQQQSNGEQSSNSNSGNGGGNSQQQNRKQQQQPDWLDEMESQSKTLSNRINYTWQ